MLLLALETAASPSEAVEALLTVQAMLVGDSIAQVTASRFLLVPWDRFASITH